MRPEEVDAVSAGPPDLGTGLFGYRRTAVHQIIGDRDAMLRHLRANEKQLKDTKLW